MDEDSRRIRYAINIDMMGRGISPMDQDSRGICCEEGHEGGGEYMVSSCSLL